MRFSLIVPVYNRPDEIEELLQSLVAQTEKNFEVIIVEDGSTEPCENILTKYSSKLSIHYYFKENEKPAIARNYGVKRCSGDYFLFVDSDCIIPPNYFEHINKVLGENFTDAFGGPDAAHPDFNAVQKAISYSMTSFFTTGGIRGGSEKMDKFYPRSFNMGISRTAFEKIGGFPETKMHPGEDMVFSIEIIKQGFKTQLIQSAFVYHKRRNTLKTFFKQVFLFGKTRRVITKLYPETAKIFFWAPAAFTIGLLSIFFVSITLPWVLLLPFFYGFLIFSDSIKKNKDLKVSILSIATSYIQLIGYGLGFIISFFRISILQKDEYKVFKQGFYKV